MGYVQVPYLLDTKIKVTFDGITLNTERQLIAGKLVTTYDKLERNVVDFSDELQKIKNISQDIKVIAELAGKVGNAIQKAVTQGFLSKEEYEALKKDNREKTELSKALLAELKSKNALSETQYNQKVQELDNDQECLESNDCITEKDRVGYVNHSKTTGYGMAFEEDIFYSLKDDCVQRLSNCGTNIEKNNADIAETYEKAVKEATENENTLYWVLQAMKNLGSSAFLKCKECTGEAPQKRQPLDGSHRTFTLKTAKGTQLKCMLGAAEKNGISFHLFDENQYLSGEVKQKLASEFGELSKILSTKNKKEFLFLNQNNAIVECSVELTFSNAFCNSDIISNKDQEFVAKELENCFDNNINFTQIKKDFDFIKNQFREDQSFEWEHNGKIYALNADNQIEEVQNALSDEDIISGNWQGQEEQKIRFYRNENGITQLKAFGFRRNLPIAKDKKADLEAVSKHILEQTNVYFKDLKDINQKASQIDEDAFADGRKIAIDNEATYIRIFSEGVGITKTLLKTGEVESGVYLDAPKEKAFIKAPGLVTGSVEVVAQKVTDLTNLGVLVYDIAVDEQTRQNLKTQFSDIKNQIGEDPKQFFPILGEVILTIGTGNTSQEWKDATNENTDFGKRSHLATRGTGNAILTIVAGTAIVKDLPEVAKKLGEKIKEVKAKKLIHSLKRFDVAGEFAKGKNIVEQTIKWGEEQIILKWKRVGNKIDFGNRNDLAKILGTADNIEAHHILPWEICKKDIVIQKAALDGFHPNMVENGLGLEKYSKLIGDGMHGNHPAYDNYVKSKLEGFILDNPKTTPEQANKFLQEELIPDLKTKIIEAQNSGLNLNEYFKSVN